MGSVHAEIIGNRLKLKMMLRSKAIVATWPTMQQLAQMADSPNVTYLADNHLLNCLAYCRYADHHVIMQTIM